MSPFETSDSDSPVLDQEAGPLDDFREYAEVYRHQQELEDELELVKRRRKALEPQLMNYLGQNNIPRMTIEDYTFSTQRVPWVYPAEGYDRNAVIQALKESGLEKLVKEEYSTQSLTGYVRELEEAHEEELASGALADIRPCLPEALRAVVRIEPEAKLRITPATRKKSAPRPSEEPNP